MHKKIIWLLLILACIALMASILLGIIENRRTYEISLISSTQNILTLNPPKFDSPSTEVFIRGEIPAPILEKMIGNSIPDNATVDTSQLSYLQITYWGFDEEAHIGEMIVHKKLAQEVLDIFEEIYEQKYPIEKMKLIDEYEADDRKSMSDNNTSAFCYRPVSNTNKLSNHALGRAIDINPLYNPYVVGSYISPTNGTQYANRSLHEKGMIQKGDALHTAFMKRGWTWGGNWNTQKDYQHFEKR